MKLLNMIFKDIKIYLSDKKALVILILMPLILILILSSALKGSFSSEGLTEPIKIVIVKDYNREIEEVKFEKFVNDNAYIDEEDKKNLLSAMEDFQPEKFIFEDFLDSNEISQILTYTIENEKKAQELLEEKLIASYVLLPEDYIYSSYLNMLTSFRNEISIKINGHTDYAYSTSIVNHVFTTFTDYISLSAIDKNVILETASSMNLSTMYYRNIDYIMEQIQFNSDGNKLIEKIEVPILKTVDSFTYYAIAMMSMFVLFSGGIVARSLLTEKTNYTYQRIIVAGGKISTFLMSKFFVIFFLCIIQMSIIIFISKFLLGVNWIINLNNILLIVSLGLATSGLGAFIGAITLISNDYKIASAFENVIIQMMALLGGSYIPVEILPAFMQEAGSWTINGIALEGFMSIFQGGDIDDIKMHLLKLILSSILSLCLAFIFIKGKEVKDDARLAHSKN